MREKFQAGWLPSILLPNVSFVSGEAQAAVSIGPQKPDTFPSPKECYGGYCLPLSLTISSTENQSLQTGFTHAALFSAFRTINIST